MTESNVDRLTAQLRRMAVEFEIKPDERIREGEMAKRLNVSRTPLREALNRLVSEGYLTSTGGQGFFCRSLTPKRILDLYEARAAVECEAIRHSVDRASDADIERLAAKQDAAEPIYEVTGDRLHLLEMDEAFHMALVQLSGNEELERMLANINGRIRYVRMIGLDMEGVAPGRIDAHRLIVSALAARDLAKCLKELRGHIELRMEDATQAVRDAFSHIYVQAG